MCHAHQELTFRPGVVSAVSLRLWCGIGMALLIGIWTSPEAWALTVSPTAMTFQAVQGATNPPSQTVNVSKSNKRQSSWIATDNASWLSLSPGVGSITSTAQVGLTVNTAGLAPGTYSATVTILVDKGGSSSVPVTLTVVPPPTSGTSTTSGSTTSSGSTTTSGSSTTPTTSTSTMATLTWSPVTSTSLAGYKVYVGTASGRYGTPLDVGNVTGYVVNNLVVGNTYYFVVTSYNTSGGESIPSTEVSKSIY